MNIERGYKISMRRQRKNIRIKDSLTEDEAVMLYEILMDSLSFEERMELAQEIIEQEEDQRKYE